MTAPKESNRQTMRALVWEGRGRAPILAERPIPADDFGSVRVSVSYVYLGAREVSLLGPRLEWVKVPWPLTLGYQGVGRVDGRVVFLNGLVACGQCSLCAQEAGHLCRHGRLLGMSMNGCAAEYVSVPPQALFPVPASVPEHLVPAMSEVGTALRALQRGGGTIGKRVAVIGGGNIGLTAALLARIGGASEVVVVDPDSNARAFAVRLLGKSGAVAPADLGQVMMDLVVEASGSEAGIALAIKSAGFGGAVVFLSVLGPTSLVFENLFDQAIARELSIFSSHGKTREDLATAARLLATQPLLQDVFSFNAVRGFDEAPEVIAGLLSGKCRGPVPIAIIMPATKRTF